MHECTPELGFIIERLQVIISELDFFVADLLYSSIGESSMIQEEKLLFAAALENSANQKFVLLSDRTDMLLWLEGEDQFIFSSKCEAMGISSIVRVEDFDDS
ncbi:hypothetical protein HS088_TW12G00761 [Tripterygium wilfordii]|uniref:Uncharacterized protein n=1 Tax=Tripterygium wilfordii TaxID=458696 RepID=A0A7J7CZP8_TRIWF|nr:hypothetical protein HS088_TW12G00761 [Tripterygium wilfordii]